MKIKILQWNVWIFEKKENILKLIQELNPDVVCMQELTVGSTFQDGANVAEYLARETGFHQFHKIIPNLAPSEGVGDLANGIISRYPISSTRWEWVQEPQNGGKNYDDQYRLYVEASIETGLQKITIGTAHLSYTDKLVEIESKNREADKLFELVKDKDSNYMLLGDLNSQPGSYTINKLSEKFENAGPDFNQKTWTTKLFSYNGFEANTLDWRLDYVFATSDIKVISSEIIKTEVSDHLPIFVTVEI